MDRVRGLDAIRAVCAFWVVMGHLGGPPVTFGIDKSASLGWLVGGVYNNFWNGPAAVIVFFVISGFCIHYPFSRTLQIPSLVGYGTRRYLRVGVPFAVGMFVSPLLGIDIVTLYDRILWSLVAELVYYTLYPGLLALRRQGVAWRSMVICGFVAAFVLIGTNPAAKPYPSWGIGLDWLLGLPCWLLGCELAEMTANNSLPNSRRLWSWRYTVWGVSVAISLLRFHSPIGYPWTLNVFGILVACWLSREIRHFQDHEPTVWLEWAGKWSYSVYLIHLPASALIDMQPLPNLGPILNWSVHMIFLMIASYLFYLLVEFPAHILARSIGRAVSFGYWDRKNS